MGYDRGDSFPFNLNQMEFNLVQNRKENYLLDHIPFNVKGNGNIVFSAYANVWMGPSRLKTVMPLCAPSKIEENKIP